MRRAIILALALFLISNAFAQTSIESQVNYFFSQNNINMNMEFKNQDDASYAKLQDNYLVIEKTNKALAVDLDSFKANTEIIMPNMILRAEGPEIILSNDNEMISVKQIGEGTTKIFFGAQANEDEKAASVFIVSHYYPEKELSDKTRENGKARLTAIAKNNPSVEISNNGLTIIPNQFIISTRTFFQSDLSNSQADILNGDRVNEIIGFADSLLVKISVFNYDFLFDRGYKTEGILSEKKITGFDVTPEQCSKLGFVFLPGYGYDFLGKTGEFTGNRGWVMGLAYTETSNFETSMDDMSIFINKASENNLTVIVRIDSNEADANQISDFINKLANATQNKLEYVQLMDKPNIKGISAEDYAQLVIDVRNSTDKKIKIISAGLMPGRKGIKDNKTLYDSEEYILSLAEFSEFFDSIDYWGSYIYDMNISGEDCIIGGEVYDEELCIDDITNYKRELEMIKAKTGKNFETIVEAGYPLKEEKFRKTHALLQSLKEDNKVKAALIYSANSWKDSPDDAWLNEDGSFNAFSKNTYENICR